MEINDSDIFEESHVWRDQEIQQLLSIIDEMNLANELTSEEFAPKAIEIIKNGLLIAGHCKSFEEIVSMLISLRTKYLENKTKLFHGIDTDMCPYYDTLERIWSSHIILNSNKKKMDRVDENIEGKIVRTSQLLGENILNQRNSPWSHDETVVLLDLIDEMNLAKDFRHRLSPMTMKKLVIPLAYRGYVRTCNQIIGKLRSIRDNYLRCVRTGRTPLAINNCPFFDKIDKMFQRLLVNNDLSSLQPIDHDYEKFEISIDPLNANTQEISESDLTWQPIQSLTVDDGGASFRSVEFPLNVETTQNYIEEELEVTNSENIKINGCNNNTIDTESNLDIYSNLSTDGQIDEVENDESYSLQNDINFPNVERIKLKTGKFRTDNPRYIRIARGKSKYILRKIDAPYMKSKSIKRKRPHSTIEESNVQSIEIPTSVKDKPPSPIRITMTRKLKTEPMRHVESPLLVNSTCSQTDSINNDFQISETMKMIMKQLLNHQEQMQQQHHEWMEKQFEIQREHDYKQRQLLLDELREFRKELRDVTEQLFTE